MAVLLERQVAPPIPIMEAGEAAPDKKLHPFFSAPRPANNLESDADAAGAAQAATESISHTPQTSTSDDDDQSLAPNQSAPKRRKRKSEAAEAQPTDGKKKRGRPRKIQKSSPSPIEECLEQKTTEGAIQNGCTGAADEPATTEPREEQGNVAPTSVPLEPASVTSVQATVTQPPQSEPAKPKKMLVFNPKSGTLGSPPKPKAPSLKPGLGTKTPKGRGAKQGPLIACARYGEGLEDDERVRIGTRINDILASPSPTKAGLPETPDKSDTAPARAAQLAKTVQIREPKISRPPHPFFMGKSERAELVAESKECRPTPPAPSSPKRPRGGTLDGTRAPSTCQPTFGIKHSGVKVPGARHPAWPWKGTAHVGRDDILPLCPGIADLELPLRKSKGNATAVGEKESVVSELASSLNIPAIIDEVRNINTDDFLPPPIELRLPHKHCESGRKLQQRVRGHLRTLGSSPSMAHFFGSIKTSLSAHDRSQCESLAWAQKFAPASAAEVLQAGREMGLLRDWLVSLKVQTVDTGATDGSAPSGKNGSKDAKKKRKRNKLDGFVVSSDDEADEMGKLSESEGELSLTHRYWATKKTVVRGGDGSHKSAKDAPRLRNAVVISGPHGCGKSAAVYALAKELGFEVFEISPSSRRSGKDIVEKIGDMTRNHQVQQHHSGASAGVRDGKDSSLPTEEQVAAEVQSGKQSTMNSFFKPKAVAKAKPMKPQPEVQTASPTEPSETRKAAPRSQKQSLILLEEVDILYEEDKQFWSTVIGLMAQSKRPFIMTCNDEALVPLQTLSLHGIFRFSAPPADLAVDRLLIMAAHEGHALTRRAVESLYESRGRDLRASITELNYWCQLGVGDRRGGFEWFYLRWPRGIDLDENGDVIRVISEGTYEEGMGWLGREPASDRGSAPLLQETGLLQQSWDNCGFDLGNWQDCPELESWAKEVKTIADTSARRLEALDAYDNFADAMSLADLNAAMAPVWSHELQIDATLPAVPTKAKDDLVLGLTFLEATPTTSFDSISTSLSIALKSLSRHLLWRGCDERNLDCAQYLAPLHQDQATALLHKQITQTPPSAPAVNRLDFAMAFDPIAATDEGGAGPVSYLDPSVWDRTMKVITLDVAPFVRGIVAYDNHLQQQRLRLGSLMSQGGVGGPKKRMRTTRAAYSAMEGGQRSTTRAERWFKADLNPFLVGSTAPRGCVAEAATLGQGPGSASDCPAMDRGSSEDEEEECRPLPCPGKAGGGGKRRAGRRRPLGTVVNESSDVEPARESDDELAA
ncbi:hypothetical protein RB596_008729 [Gaeumannomyces avenae]